MRRNPPPPDVGTALADEGLVDRLLELVPTREDLWPRCRDCGERRPAQMRLCCTCRVVNRRASRQRWWAANGAEWRRRRAA